MSAITMKSNNFSFNAKQSINRKFSEENKTNEITFNSSISITSKTEKIVSDSLIFNNINNNSKITSQVDEFNKLSSEILSIEQSIHMLESTKRIKSAKINDLRALIVKFSEQDNYKLSRNYFDNVKIMNNISKKNIKKSSFQPHGNRSNENNCVSSSSNSTSTTTTGSTKMGPSYFTTTEEANSDGGDEAIVRGKDDDESKPINLNYYHLHLCCKYWQENLPIQKRLQQQLSLCK